MRNLSCLITLATVLLVALVISAASNNLTEGERFAGTQEETTTGTSFRSPLHNLDPTRIPAHERFRWQPPELVAVLGEHRGRHWQDINAVAFSPDGQQIASAGWDRVIRFWDAATLCERGVLKHHTADVRCIAFSPDGKTLASASGDETLVLWDLTRNPPKPRTLLKVKGGVRALAFSLTGGTFAAIDEAVRVWKVRGDAALEPIALVEGTRIGLRALALSPDGTKLASADRDEVFLWDLAAGNKKTILKTPLQQLWSVAFSPDGKTLACCGEDRKARKYLVILWDLSDRDKPLEKAILDKHTRQVLAVKFSRDGKTLASGGPDGVRLWNLTSPAIAEKAIVKTRGWGKTFDISPDSNTFVGEKSGGALQLWNLNHAPPQERLTLTGHTSSAQGLALTCTGLLASSGRDFTVRLWDLSAAQPKQGLVLDKAWGPLALSRDGKTLVCAGNVTALEVWDIGQEKPRRRFHRVAHRTPQVSGLSGLGISPDGKVLVSSGVDGFVRFWDLTTDEPVEKAQFRMLGSSFTLGPWRQGAMATVASYGPEGEEGPGVSQPANTVRLWNLTGPKPSPHAVLEHSERVYPVVFAPDGKTLVTGTGNRVINQVPLGFGKLRLWRQTNQGPTFRATLLAADLEQINSVAFSPDGQMLASAGWQGQIILWETATGKKYREWALPGPAYRVLFDEHGRHLLTANGNGTIFVLRLGHGQTPATDSATVWESLGSADASKAFAAIGSLIAAPQSASNLLKDRLYPVPSVDPKEIKQWIDRLNDPLFKAREEARAMLEKLHDLAVPVLRSHLADDNVSLESRRRIEQILEKLEQPSLTDIRSSRAIQVLEYIGNEPARQILRRLAGGASAARVTRHAQAALERLREEP